MSYPEPSIHDCGAPWNESTILDEDGEEIDVCGCASCQRKRREEATDYGDYE